MSQPTQDGIKEKVLSVREVVPGRSNNEIILVLTYYDYSVEDAIQAFLEDGAKAALEEWHYPGNKPNNKKKKKKQAQKKAEQAAKDSQQAAAAPASSQTPAPATANKEAATPATESTAKKGEPTKNGPLREEDIKSTEAATPVPQAEAIPAQSIPEVNGMAPKTQPSASVEVKPARPTTSAPRNSSSEAFLEKMSQAAPAASASTGQTSHRPQGQQKRPHTLETGSRAARERTLSELSVSSVASSTQGDSRSKLKPHAGLEKSIKDLQRQTTSLQRLKLVFTEEVEKSFKTMSAVFEDLRLALNEREAELMFEMDKMKQLANETLQKRQGRAAELKLRADRAQVMTETELAELRADIKHFVSDRKVDEDVTKSARFIGEAEELLKQVKAFGEISPVKHAYSQRRPSVSSVSSSVFSHDDTLSSPLTPTTPVFAASPTLHPTGATVSFVSHSNPPSTSPSLPASRSREITSLTEKFTSALSLHEARPSTPSQKSAGTSPQRQPNPHSAPAAARQKESEASIELRKSRNARRRQKQRDRERESTSNSISSENNTPIASPAPAPSTDLEKKERPQQNGPRQMAHRGTSPMKQPAATSSQGKPAQGHQEGHRQNSRSSGQRSDYQGHSDRSYQGHSDRPYQGRSGQNRNAEQGQGQGQGQGQRRQRDRRPRNPKTGTENNAPRNDQVNGVVANGVVNETNNNELKSMPSQKAAPKSKTVEPLKQNDLKLNKQEDNSATGLKKEAPTGNNHKLIENGAGENAEPEALPQRKPRNRGARHAQENKKSQVVVNGSSEAPEANGHS